MKRIISLNITLIGLLLLSACTTLTPKHNAQDKIIIGNENAPNQMTIVFSPACHHCLKVFHDTFQDLRQNFVETGKLSIALYVAPSAIAPPKIDATIDRYQAGDLSHNLAGDLKCIYAYKGSTAYANSIQTLASLAANKLGDRLDSWPYGDQEQVSNIIQEVRDKSGLSPTQFEQCRKDPIREEISTGIVNDTYTARSIHSVPGYLLNGQTISFDYLFDKERFFDYLDQEIK